MEDYREPPDGPEEWVPPDGHERADQSPLTPPVASPPPGEGDAADDAVDADADAVADTAVVDVLRERLDCVVEDSRLIAAAEASRLRGVYLMLQDALAHPGIFIPNAAGLTRADLTAESEGWVRTSLAQEIGAALGVTKGHAAGLLNDAEALCETLPATLDALDVGKITRQHADAMIRQSVGLDAEATAVFEREALPKALCQSPTQFSRAVVKIREGLFPDTITKRRTEAVKERRVDCYGAHDGMGVLAVRAPIEVVQSLHNAARLTARALKAAGDDRTLAQIETDTIIDALMIGFTNDSDQKFGGAPGVGASGVGADRLGGIRPTVYVTVPVMTLLGHSDEPGQLDGYGPIDPDVARELAARAPSFTRLLTHPETGAVLSVGRDSYTVPADLKRAVQLRDETCIGIGCDRPATTCDLDHREEWQHGGQTSLTNLQAACEQHHMIRHNTTWTVTVTDDNDIIWISPLGRTCRVPRTSNVQFAAGTATTKHDDTANDERKELPNTPPF
ncbi:HNH endonuclease signature motif containing protein [Paramicrobacterium chengjingii]|uniref:DUF222 domain-containing protein n=1 Tax=Paramicrobacterium chengjingii TaxID=2769067 RepID=A0ABX6YFF4_9MICO|nr:HNH endonuclease signature motif containing protein [Microbacterium chengjingii]QPZ37509.1 DUF222 domain-containing protein [Microbacterium chengjingii]